MLTSALALLFAMSGPDFTKQNEGLRLDVYTDTTHHRTVGYGHKLDDGDTVEHWTKDEADTQYAIDYVNARVSAQVVVGADHWQKLPYSAQTALTDMAFNLGAAGLKRFKNFLIDIRAHNYSQAANELARSKYARQCPNRVKLLQAVLRGEANIAP